MNNSIANEKIYESKEQFLNRLNEAKKAKPVDLDIDKIVEGFLNAEEKFKAFHIVFSEMAERDLQGWYPDQKTLLKMRAYVREMKIFLVLAVISDTYQKREYCKHDIEWWLSRFGTISNVVVDVAAAVVIAGESFIKDSITASEVDQLSISYNSSTSMVPQEEHAISYWGITAISISLVFSKFRAIAQGKSVEYAERLAKLAKVIRGGKITLKEYQNFLNLWNKTASFLQRESLLTKSEYEKFKNDCGCLDRKLPVVRKARNALRKLYSGLHSSSSPITESKDVERELKEENFQVVNIAVGAATHNSKQCCIKVEKINITFSQLCEMHNQLLFARNFVAQAVKDVNAKTKNSQWVDYYQPLMVIEKEQEKVLKIFANLESIPVDFFKEPKEQKVYRAIGVFIAELIAMVLAIIEKYDNDLGDLSTTMKIVSLVFFAAGAIFSGICTALHSKEMYRLKLVREVEHLKSLKESIVHDLEIVSRILQNHQLWVKAQDDHNRETAYINYLKTLSGITSNKLGLRIKKLKKVAKRLEHQSPYSSPVLKMVGLDSANIESADFDSKFSISDEDETSSSDDSNSDQEINISDFKEEEEYSCEKEFKRRMIESQLSLTKQKTSPFSFLNMTNNSKDSENSQKEDNDRVLVSEIDFSEYDDD